jgi:hypothetical protein
MLTYRRLFEELLAACPEHMTVSQRIRSFNGVTKVKLRAISRALLFVQL